MKLQEMFEEGWYAKLAPFLKSNDFKHIARVLATDASTGLITPRFDETFRAFKECPFSETKVVILGQDPYPGYGDADGLAFSSRKSMFSDPPRSLQYIFQEIEKDVYDGFAIPFNENYLDADLTRWAKQGVLLLNLALSTQIGKTRVHLDLWAPFMRYLFGVLREYQSGLTYILMGADAKKWAVAIDKDKNHILTCSHPASAYHNQTNKWDSEQVFSKANVFVEKEFGSQSRILW